MMLVWCAGVGLHGSHTWNKQLSEPERREDRRIVFLKLKLDERATSLMRIVKQAGHFIDFGIQQRGVHRPPSVSSRQHSPISSRERPRRERYLGCSSTTLVPIMNMRSGREQAG